MFKRLDQSLAVWHTKRRAIRQCAPVVATDEIEMGTDRHQRSRNQRGVNAARGIGEDEPLYSEVGRDTNGTRHDFARVAFVEVQSAQEEEHRPFAPQADSEPTRMALHGWRSQSRYVTEGDGSGFAKARSYPAQTRTEDNGSRWAKAADRTLKLGEKGHHRPARSDSSFERISSNICLVRMAQAMNCAAPSSPNRSTFTTAS